MGTTKAQKNILIDDIFNLLSTHTDQTEIFVKICQKHQMSERTFYRYLKIASQRHTEQQRMINMQIIGTTTSVINERLRTALWSQEECIWKLQDDYSRAKRTSDRINAIKLICDIQGYKAPIKSEIDLIQQTPIFSRNPLLNGIDKDHQYIA